MCLTPTSWDKAILLRLSSAELSEVEPEMETITKAIEILAKKITTSTTPDEALKFTQAALNLAHTQITLKNIDK